jgi:hypothetical protein
MVRTRKDAPDFVNSTTNTYEKSRVRMRMIGYTAIERATAPNITEAGRWPYFYAYSTVHIPCTATTRTIAFYFSFTY